MTRQRLALDDLQVECRRLVTQARALLESIPADLAIERPDRDAVIQLIEDARKADLNRIPFRHPFLPAVRFNVAAGLLMTAAHARRHLWLADRARAQLRERSAVATRLGRMGENQRLAGTPSLDD